MWSTINFNAKKRGLAMGVTKDEAWKLFLGQQGRCALSGCVIVIRSRNKDHCANRSTASLDRIDSAKGYIRGNIQWVHKDVNRMKHDLDETRFIEFCRLIAKHRGS